MPDRTLLAFHLGPVQDFIATARRTQDLWMGSWLLSHLSRTAFKTATDGGAQAILPKELPTADDKTVADTPNHFLVRFNTDNSNVTAAQIEEAVRGEWKRITDKVKEVFFLDADPNLWSRQTEKFLEVYWALVPEDGARARNRAQAALDARKRLRDFEPADEPFQKCTLCGLRQELSGQASVGEAREWWKRLVENLGGRLRVREDGNERLCAVCAVKRSVLMSGALKQAGLEKTDRHFPSTSGVAAATFKRRLLEADTAESHLENYFLALMSSRDGLGLTDRISRSSLPGLKELSEKNHSLPEGLRNALLSLDGDLFYAETLTEKRFTEEFPEAVARLKRDGRDVASLLDAAAKRLREVYRAVEARPAKYFAVLKLDGDRMGKFFGEANDELAGKLSARISLFAREDAKASVEAHLGRMIYAGGDDLLALLPLEEALPCARELQKGFQVAVAEVLGHRQSDGARHPTLSAGVAVANHTAPFDLTLQATAHAESSAKNRYGRDALCVHVLKRSGEEVRVGTHWTAQSSVDSEDGASLVAIVEQLIGLLRDKKLSMKFAHAVADEARSLELLPFEGRSAELRRLGKRHRGERYDEKEIAGLCSQLARWAEMRRGEGEKQESLGLEEVSRWILLARFVASGGRDEE
jgi:CRISPR-associated protein Cmr2